MVKSPSRTVGVGPRTDSTSTRNLPAESLPQDAAARRDAERFLIHARSLEGALSYLRERGVTEQNLTSTLAAYGLAEARTAAFDGYISMDRFSRFLDHYVRELPDEAMGLQLAQHLDAGSLGVVDQAFVSAPTLGAALEAICRYFCLLADVSFVSLTVDRERAEFSWAYSPLLVTQDVLNDRAAGLWLKRTRETFGADLTPLDVRLHRRRPKDIAPYLRMLGGRVSFDAPAISIRLRTVDLDRVNPKADRYAHEMAIELAERMLGERRVPDDLAVRTREDILAHLAEDRASLDETARRLAMTPRSLQRRLNDLGSSYQSIADEVRYLRASELLKRSDLPINEIAHQLGFANQANLTRASKRWFGKSPRMVRKELAGS